MTRAIRSPACFAVKPEHNCHYIDIQGLNKRLCWKEAWSTMREHVPAEILSGENGDRCTRHTAPMAACYWASFRSQTNFSIQRPRIQRRLNQERVKARPSAEERASDLLGQGQPAGHPQELVAAQGQPAGYPIRCGHLLGIYRHISLNHLLSLIDPPHFDRQLPQIRSLRGLAARRTTLARSNAAILTICRKSGKTSFLTPEPNLPMTHPES